MEGQDLLRVPLGTGRTLIDVLQSRTFPRLAGLSTPHAGDGDGPGPACRSYPASPSSLDRSTNSTGQRRPVISEQRDDALRHP